MQRILQIHRRFPPLGAALRQTLREGYGRRELRADLLAGISVGIIAVPLALALAIASGVPPQHGLYTAIVAGLVIALAGGSRFNVSGPTAAFVVILQPIAVQYGLGGLLLATLMAGVMLVAMGWGRAGQLIQFIPYPVTTGFTAGIAVVIASLQLKDFLGLAVTDSSHFIERMQALALALPTINPAEAALGLAVLLLLALWPRLGTRVPAYLVGAVFAGASAWSARLLWPDCGIVTVADRFAYTLDGVVHGGIPPLLPGFHWPWDLPGPDGAPLQLDFDLLRSLLGPAFAIAMLGAIESLLCAVVADGMTGRKHDPDAELVAQGLGNIAAPLLGGIPATGALARTAANVRAGARSPLSSVFHAMFVLAAMLLLAPLLSWLPMSGLAALLLMVAWNMSERHNVMRILRVAPRGDVLLLLVCFGLTVFFDMVIAVGFGVVLASLFFMHRMSRVAMVTLVGEGDPQALPDLPAEVRYYRIAGPLFFGAAERAMSALRRNDHGAKALLLDLSAVPTIDATGLVALEEVLDELHESGVFVALCGAQRSVLGVLRDAGYTRQAGARWYFASADAALRWWQRQRVANSSPARRSKHVQSDHSLEVLKESVVMSWNENNLGQMGRPAPVRSTERPLPRAVFGAEPSALETNKVLRNTYMLLSMTLLFSAAMAGVSMVVGAPYGVSLVCSLVALGLLWFVVPRTANSEAGIWVVFAVTGLLGFGLGPVINMYLKGFANGSQIVMMAFGLTGTIFVGLSAYAIKTRRDFSFMRGFLFTGILIAFVVSIGMLVASFFGFYLQPLALGISAMFALLMCGLILYQTGEIVNGGETNYVLATVTLYVSIYNLFTSLLHLLGFASGDD